MSIASVRGGLDSLLLNTSPRCSANEINQISVVPRGNNNDSRDGLNSNEEFTSSNSYSENLDFGGPDGQPSRRKSCCGYFFKKMGDITGRDRSFCCCCFTLVAVSLILFACSVVVLPINTVGLQKNSITKFINYELKYTPGRYLLGLGQEMVDFPQTRQLIKFCKGCKDGNRAVGKAAKGADPVDVGIDVDMYSFL